MENRVRAVEFDEAAFWHDPAHGSLEVSPAVVPAAVAEIIKDDETALEQIFSKRDRLSIGQRHIAGFGHVRHRVPEHFRIADRDYVCPVEAWLNDACDALENFHQAAFSCGVAMSPSRQAVVV